MKTGRIYKIVHNQSNIVYVGSTFNLLKNRWQNHKNTVRRENKKECCIVKYLKEYGVENFTIILIKEYQVCDRKHLQAWEQYWINKLTCINKVNALRFLYEKKLKKIKRKENKEKIRIQQRKWYEKNREKVLARVKNNTLKNREKIRLYQKEYRKKLKKKR